MKDTEEEDDGKNGKRCSGNDLPHRVGSEIHASPTHCWDQNEEGQRLASVNNAQRGQRSSDAQCVRADFPVARDVLHEKSA